MAIKPNLPVIFRVFKEGDVIALFPTVPATRSGLTVESYMHVGQHGEASLDLVQTTRLARPKEYANLFAELKAIGYDNLKVYRRATRTMGDERRKAARS